MTMMILAAITAKSPMIFMARRTLRMMKPGPASRLLVSGILGERLEVKKLTELQLDSGPGKQYKPRLTHINTC
jgi:hypothetical protein